MMTKKQYMIEREQTPNCSRGNDMFGGCSGKCKSTTVKIPRVVKTNRKEGIDKKGHKRSTCSAFLPQNSMAKRHIKNTKDILNKNKGS